MNLKKLVIDLSLADIAKSRNLQVDELYRDLIKQILDDYSPDSNEIEFDKVDGVEIYKTEGAWEDYNPAIYTGQDQYTIEQYLKNYEGTGAICRK